MIAKWNSSNRDDFTTKCDSYYKMRRSLQIVTVEVIISTDFKNFDRDKFKRELEGKINENSNLIDIYDFFGKTFLLVLNNY